MKGILLWVTNFAAPYRLPVWDELAERDRSFKVFVLDVNDTNRLWGGLHASRDYLRLFRTRIVHVFGRPTYLLTQTRRLWKEVRKTDGVVIGGWEHFAYWQTAAVAALNRVPRIVFYESTTETHSHARGPMAAARRIFLRHAGKIVLVPGAAAREAVARLGVPSQRIVEGFNSIDAAAVLEAVRRSGRTSSDRLRVCFVGQLVSRKNVDTLIRAFFLSDGDEADLHIVGSGPDEVALRRLARTLEVGTTKRVFWHGGLGAEAALDVMVRCDCLVLVSTEEVWGLVVNEALTAGLRVIVTPNCGVYASVQAMKGVHPTGATVREVTEALNHLAAEPRGWIAQPAILTVGSPQLFAEKVVEAMLAAKDLSRTGAKRRR